LHAIVYQLLSGNEQYYCSRCKKHQDSTKALSIYRAPHILVVTIKRFSAGYVFRDSCPDGYGGIFAWRVLSIDDHCCVMCAVVASPWDAASWKLQSSFRYVLIFVAVCTPTLIGPFLGTQVNGLDMGKFAPGLQADGGGMSCPKHVQAAPSL